MFTQTRFTSWGLPEPVQAAIDSQGWEFATEVQRDTVPLARRGRDVIGQARTGSGKTAAFGLPLIERCAPGQGLQALVLAPTRELAVQVAEELDTLQGHTGLRMQTVYGGTDVEKQATLLDAGVDVIVGTPGRVMDMAERGHIDLASPTLFVLDEADRMLDMGFFPDILWVLERMTSRQQTLLFSATFPQEIVDAAFEFMTEPEFVQTNEDEIDLPDVRLCITHVGRSNKLWATARLLLHLEEDGQAIIFANTKRMVDLLIERLSKAKFEVDGLHGDLSQNQRERILGTFRDGKLRIIVATDVAARGIDVDSVTMVINYDVPNDMDAFIHRVGRTGRIGRTGQAWTLVDRTSGQQMQNIIATYDLPVEDVDVPDLPDGVERDPVAWQEDLSDAADPFGFITLRVDVTDAEGLSKADLEDWLVETVGCDSMAVGRIVMGSDHSEVGLHSSVAARAMKAFAQKELAGSTRKVDLVVL